MDRQDAIERIRRCLALGTSANPHEAEAALLKARALMARYKVEESELRIVPEDEVVRRPVPYTYSPRRIPWLPILCVVIASNHCCECYNTRQHGKQTRTEWIIGKADDVEVCLAAIELAYAVITGNLTSKHSPSERDSYAIGFLTGLNAAYKEQTRRNEGWGLVLTVPPEVTEELDGLDDEHWRPRLDVTSRDDFDEGVADGRNHVTLRLEVSE